MAEESVEFGCNTIFLLIIYLPWWNHTNVWGIVYPAQNNGYHASLLTLLQIELIIYANVF